MKVAKEHLRHATEDEIRACQIVAGELAFQGKRLAQGSERHGSLDLTGEEPVEIPDHMEVRGETEGSVFCRQDQNGTEPERMPGEISVAREEPAVEKDRPGTPKSGVGPPRGPPAPSPEPVGEENICETGLQVGPPPPGEGG